MITDIERVQRIDDAIEITAITGDGTQTILMTPDAARRLVALLYKALDDPRSMW